MPGHYHSKAAEMVAKKKRAMRSETKATGGAPAAKAMRQATLALLKKKKKK